MKLDFKILWIDDDWKRPETSVSLNRVREGIEKHLEDEFFIPTIEISDGEGLDIITDSHKYDLFLIDFNLGSEKGLKHIETIRNDSIFTEIIFYSQSPNFKHDLMEYCKDKSYIEGIFLTDRNDLGVKFKRVLDVIDKKVNNLNTMRGLVIAETSDLDYILCEIIDKSVKVKDGFYTGNYDDSTKKYDFSVGKKFQSHRTLDFVSWLATKGNNKIYYKLLTDSGSSICLQDVGIIGKINDYRDFYENKRNPLSHVPNNQQHPFSITDLKNMRKELLEYRTAFELFRDTI